MKFVIFHGAFGSKNSNWFPSLKKELETLNQEVILEQFPIEDYVEITKKGPETTSSKNQNLKNWFTFFEKNIFPKLSQNDHLCFVGHSLSPVFILHLIDKYSLKLDSAIFVSPFMESLKNKKIWQYDLVNSTFYKTDFNFKKLKRLIPTSYVLYGDNDPYVNKKFPLDFAKKMSSKVIAIKNGGHLNSESGYNKFPLLLDICRSLLNK